MNIQLSNEKEKNNKLSYLLIEGQDKVSFLTKQLSEEKNINLKMQQRNNDTSYNSNNKEELFLLYKKINNLNETLKRYPVILEENEKLISIIFASLDQTMHYSMICKNTDTISGLEQKLYSEYPKFIDSNNVFLCNGIAINRNRSFESYKIKNGDIIIVNKIDD